MGKCCSSNKSVAEDGHSHARNNSKHRQQQQQQQQKQSHASTVNRKVVPQAPASVPSKQPQEKEPKWMIIDLPEVLEDNNGAGKSAPNEATGGKAASPPPPERDTMRAEIVSEFSEPEGDFTDAEGADEVRKPHTNALPPKAKEAKEAETALVAVAGNQHNTPAPYAPKPPASPKQEPKQENEDDIHHAKDKLEVPPKPNHACSASDSRESDLDGKELSPRRVDLTDRPKPLHAHETAPLGTKWEGSRNTTSVWSEGLGEGENASVGSPPAAPLSPLYASGTKSPKGKTLSSLKASAESPVRPHPLLAGEEVSPMARRDVQSPRGGALGSIVRHTAEEMRLKAQETKEEEEEKRGNHAVEMETNEHVKNTDAFLEHLTSSPPRTRPHPNVVEFDALFAFDNVPSTGNHADVTRLDEKVKETHEKVIPSVSKAPLGGGGALLPPAMSPPRQSKEAVSPPPTPSVSSGVKEWENDAEGTLLGRSNGKPPRRSPSSSDEDDAGRHVDAHSKEGVNGAGYKEFLDSGSSDGSTERHRLATIVRRDGKSNRKDGEVPAVHLVAKEESNATAGRQRISTIISPPPVTPQSKDGDSIDEDFR